MFDIYEAITSRIIDQLEAGIIPWGKPWTGVQDGAISGATGKPYSLLNQMLLSKVGRYYTFKQITERGGRIRKGEKTSIIVFWKQVAVSEQDPETGEEVAKLVPMLRYFNVWHEDQTEGMNIKAKPMPNEHPEAVPAADDIITAYTSREGITLNNVKGDRAYYSPALDVIVLPLVEQFPDIDEYYSTAFHEMTHSTGHKTRLNRIKATAHFGNEDYSKEELTAEIGAAALMHHTGIETAKTFRNSAAYIQSWLKALRNDKRMIVHASGAASKAVDYILTGAKA